MTVATFQLDPVTVALREWAETAFEVPVEDSIAAPDPDDLYVVLFQLASPRYAPAPLVAESVTDVTYQFTSVGTVPSQVRSLADRVRVKVAGTDRRGTHMTPMDLGVEGVAVVRRASNDDGALDVINNIPQWAETYRITLAPA